MIAPTAEARFEKRPPMSLPESDSSRRECTQGLSPKTAAPRTHAMLISHEAIARRAREIRAAHGFTQVRREECWATARWELIAEAFSVAVT
jgi:hypothetical protein